MSQNCLQKRPELPIKSPKKAKKGQKMTKKCPFLAKNGQKMPFFDQK
jgi:hypothetical protein